MMLRSSPLPLLLLIVSLLGALSCSADERLRPKGDDSVDEGDTDKGEDSDTDADTDSDADADADSDTDFYVCEGATFEDIQNAVNSARDGQVIHVCRGTWQSVRLSPTTANLTLIGDDGPEVTFIEGGKAPALEIDVPGKTLTVSGFTLRAESPKGVVAGLHLLDGEVRLENMTIAGCRSLAGEEASSRAALVDGGQSTWEEVLFEDNAMTWVLQARGESTLTMRHSVFRANEAEAAVLSLFGASFVLENNIVTANSVSAEYTHIAHLGAGNAVNNLFHDNEHTNEAHHYDSTVELYETVFKNNIVSSNSGYGISRYKGVGEVGYNDAYGNLFYNYEDGLSGEGNLSADPLFTDAAAGDFTLRGGSPCRDAGDPGEEYLDADGSRGDMGVFGGPGGSW